MPVEHGQLPLIACPSLLGYRLWLHGEVVQSYEAVTCPRPRRLHIAGCAVIESGTCPTNVAPLFSQESLKVLIVMYSSGQFAEISDVITHIRVLGLMTVYVEASMVVGRWYELLATNVGNVPG